MTDPELAAVCAATMRFGLLMLSGGASAYRVDEAMRRAGSLIGADRVEAYVTPTGIILSVHSGLMDHTQIARIRTIGVNMQRVYDAELLLREMHGALTVAALVAGMDRIEASPPSYPVWMVALGCGLGCGAFAVLRNGGPLEFAAAFCAAVLTQVLRVRLIKARLQPPPVTVICATVASSFALWFARAVGAPQPRIAIIASVLLLVPGVPLVTSLIDLLLGHLVAGVARGVYAVLLLIGIGIGVVVSVSLFGFMLV